MNVAIFGAGQLGTAVWRLLASRAGVEVAGPFSRDQRSVALSSGADLVVIATTSFLSEVAPDIRVAVEAGSNVITSAEEAAYPWAVNSELSTELDSLARAHGVTILGCGLNPGFVFDALVLTACGAGSDVESIRVERIVDLGGFSEGVLRRIGVGYSQSEFADGTGSGRITGHIGFPQSMAVVAARLGVSLERVDRDISPIFADTEYRKPHITVLRGQTAGFTQRYVGWSRGARWFECEFWGHIDPESIGRTPRDEIWIAGMSPLHLQVLPGLNPQSAAPAMIANSMARVVDARAGWLTVGDLPPATP